MVVSHPSLWGKPEPGDHPGATTRPGAMEATTSWCERENLRLEWISKLLGMAGDRSDGQKVPTAKDQFPPGGTGTSNKQTDYGPDFNERTFWPTRVGVKGIFQGMALRPQSTHGTFKLLGIMGTGIEELFGERHQSGQRAVSCNLCVVCNRTKTNQRMATARFKWT